ncbi:VraH family peptide resistance protein [Staphylococcus petrasii]|uniref:VraH family peptide resistance protein n=1 Tax=Staphylococcus petrasii TaxID=1276936 RepID=UPI001F56869C|nr:VraH family protein [Staphylococcus petrasii]MCI2774094.1 VraH family protein [Staphylococcus petrasii]
MKIKELIQQSYEDLLSLQVNWYNGLLLLLIVFLLSSITTPIIGVPVGLLGGGYFLKRQEEKNK